MSAAELWHRDPALQRQLEPQLVFAREYTCEWEWRHE